MTGPLSRLAFVAEREDVPLPGGAVVSIRALTADDIATLVRDHAGAFAAAVRSIRAEPVAALLAITEAAPPAIAHVIALAADEPDGIDAARRLPIGVTLRILCAIDKLTFGQSGERRPFAKILGPMIRPHLPAIH